MKNSVQFFSPEMRFRALVILALIGMITGAIGMAIGVRVLVNVAFWLIRPLIIATIIMVVFLIPIAIFVSRNDPK
jgi:cation transporter-like permease